MGGVVDLDVTSTGLEFGLNSCAAHLGETSGKTAQMRDDPLSADGDGPPMPHAAGPHLGGEPDSTWLLSSGNSEPRTQVGLVNHPANHQMALHHQERRLPPLSRSLITGRDAGGGLSTYDQQHGHTSSPERVAARRLTLNPLPRGASHPAGRVARPLLGRNEVATTLVEHPARNSCGLGCKSRRLHRGHAFTAVTAWPRTLRGGPHLAARWGLPPCREEA